MCATQQSTVRRSRVLLLLIPLAALGLSRWAKVHPRHRDVDLPVGMPEVKDTSADKPPAPNNEITTVAMSAVESTLSPIVS